jgi:hypothetical protein
MGLCCCCRRHSLDVAGSRIGQYWDDEHKEWRDHEPLSGFTAVQTTPRHALIDDAYLHSPLRDCSDEESPCKPQLLAGPTSVRWTPPPTSGRETPSGAASPTIVGSGSSSDPRSPRPSPIGLLKARRALFRPAKPRQTAKSHWCRE